MGQIAFRFLIALLLALGYVQWSKVHGEERSPNVQYGVPEGEGIPREAKAHKRTLVREARSIWGVEAPVGLLAAQIHQESRWNHLAKSRVGASGLTQFMPSTAEWIVEVYPELGPVDVFSPKWAIRAMVRYDKFLHDRIRGALNDCERWGFTLSAYNGGLGWVQRRQSRSEHPGRCFGATCDINPGISSANQRENSRYSRRIMLEWQPLYLNDGWGRAAVCENYLRVSYAK